MEGEYCGEVEGEGILWRGGGWRGWVLWRDGELERCGEHWWSNTHTLSLSCSWGPEDKGATVEGPGLVAHVRTAITLSHTHTLTSTHLPSSQEALTLAVSRGRYGYGNIFVFASGNGGSMNDNCNYDGYANSVYTVTVGE